MQQRNNTASASVPGSLILFRLALVGLLARRSPKAWFASLPLTCGSGGVARILSLLILFLAVGCVSSFAPTVEAIGYQFVTLDYPAPNHQTNAYSIDDSGVVAGTWRDGNTTRGFVRNGTSFTPYSAPGNVSTFLRAVNNNGDLTGAFRVSATARDGFVQSGGTFASFNVPGAAFTLPYGISSSGAITGGYTQAGVPGSRGFLRVGSTFVTYTIPGAVDVFPYAINDLGFVAGAFTDGAGEVKSFLRRPDGTIEVLDIAGADELTIFGINNAGLLVGAANEDDGVIWDGSELQLLRFPGSTRTTITDINNHGWFVGIYQDANGVTHSFSARAVLEPASLLLFASAILVLFRKIRFRVR